MWRFMGQHRSEWFSSMSMVNWLSKAVCMLAQRFPMVREMPNCILDTYPRNEASHVNLASRSINFHGTLYDVRIWNEVRSEAEIALNHQHKFARQLAQRPRRQLADGWFQRFKPSRRCRQRQQPEHRSRHRRRLHRQHAARRLCTSAKTAPAEPASALSCRAIRMSATILSAMGCLPRQRTLARLQRSPWSIDRKLDCRFAETSPAQ
jgi:hypothetical protein